jgi:Protein of unknown function (DUF3891)
MVLRPIHDPVTRRNTPGAPVPVWNAIARRQKQQAAAYWVVAQPDHAELSGALAANFKSSHFPALEAAVVRAIALHDAGWGMFDSEASCTPALTESGKPRSFIEIAPAHFTLAWTGSIDRAEQVAPISGIIVSRHFCWLAEGRLAMRTDTERDADMVRHFLRQENCRQERLAGLDPRPEDQLERFLSVLQFCDLLSLYLCCGADEEVEFPQSFNSRPVRLSRTEDAYLLTPSPFAQPVSLSVAARRYPPGAEPATTLPFIIA